MTARPGPGRRRHDALIIGGDSEVTPGPGSPNRGVGSRVGVDRASLSDGVPVQVAELPGRLGLRTQTVPASPQLERWRAGRAPRPSPGPRHSLVTRKRLLSHWAARHGPVHHWHGPARACRRAAGSDRHGDGHGHCGKITDRDPPGPPAAWIRAASVCRVGRVRVTVAAVDSEASEPETESQARMPVECPGLGCNAASCGT